MDAVRKYFLKDIRCVFAIVGLYILIIKHTPDLYAPLLYRFGGILPFIIIAVFITTTALIHKTLIALQESWVANMRSLQLLFLPVYIYFFADLFSWQTLSMLPGDYLIGLIPLSGFILSYMVLCHLSVKYGKRGVPARWRAFIVCYSFFTIFLIYVSFSYIGNLLVDYFSPL